MALSTTASKNAAASGITTLGTHAAAYSTVPSGTAGTEISGVARQPITWGAPSNGVSTATVTFTGFPAGSTIAGAGIHTALTGGTYVEGGSVTSQTFATTGGTYALTLTLTLS